MQQAILGRQIDAVIAHLLRLVARGPGTVAVGSGLRFAPAHVARGQASVQFLVVCCGGDAQGG